MRLLPVRVSATLRDLIDQVGPVNPATRALVVLGAAVAGLDLRGLEREVAALLGADLAPEVQAGLRQVYAQVAGIAPGAAAMDMAQSGMFTCPHHRMHQPRPRRHPRRQPRRTAPDDPFSTIGIDV
jgi:hypothetical protein